MLSTRHVIDLLAEVNPDAEITEHRLRSAIRYGKTPPPASTLSGRFMWTWEEVAALAEALDLVAPEPCTRQPSRGEVR